MSENESPSEREKAIEVLQHLPETVTVPEILFAIHEQSQIENDLAIGREMYQSASSSQSTPQLTTKSNGISDLLGCLFPIVVIIAIFLFLGMMFGL
jgi:hypothetical protein